MQKENKKLETFKVACIVSIDKRSRPKLYALKVADTNLQVPLEVLPIKAIKAKLQDGIIVVFTVPNTKFKSQNTLFDFLNYTIIDDSLSDANISKYISNLNIVVTVDNVLYHLRTKDRKNHLYIRDRSRTSKVSVPTLMELIKSKRRYDPPTIEKDGFWVDEDSWYYMIRSLLKGKPILIKGDKGWGKTEITYHLANALGVDNNIFDMSISNPNKILRGQKEARNGSTYYVKSRFNKTLKTHCLLTMDELTRAEPFAINLLLPILDSRACMFNEEDVKEPIVKLHDNLFIVATANIGNKFSGVRKLDVALDDRFLSINMVKPPPDVIGKLLVQRQGVTVKIADSICKIYKKIEAAPNIKEKVSMRGLLDTAENVADGYELKDALEWGIVSKYKEGQRGVIRTLIQGL